jgi:hypothetical protein
VNLLCQEFDLVITDMTMPGMTGDNSTVIGIFWGVFMLKTEEARDSGFAENERAFLIFLDVRISDVNL